MIFAILFVATNLKIQFPNRIHNFEWKWMECSTSRFWPFHWLLYLLTTLRFSLYMIEVGQEYRRWTAANFFITGYRTNVRSSVFMRAGTLLLFHVTYQVCVSQSLSVTDEHGTWFYGYCTEINLNPYALWYTFHKFTVCTSFLKTTTPNELAY